MNLSEKLYLSLCITINRYRYSYGRKPKGERLKKLLIPGIFPSYIYENVFENILEGWRKVLK